MPDDTAIDFDPSNSDRVGARVMRGVAWSYASWTVTTLAPLIMVPLYTRYLGTRTYGEWLVILSITSYLALANLGLGQTVSNRIAEAVATRRTSELTRLLSTAFVAYSLLAVVLLWLLYYTTPSFAGRLRLGEGSSVLIAFAIYVGLNLLSFPLRVYPMLLRGMERVDQEQAIGVVTNLGRIAMLAALLLAGFKLVAVAIVNGAATLASSAISYLWARSLAPDVRARVSQFSSAMLRTMIWPSAAFLGIQVGGTLIMGVDNLVIGYAIGSEAVTRYAVPYRLTFMAASVFGVAMQALAPTITAAYARRSYEELRRWLLFGMRAALLYATAGAIALWIAGPTFIHIWAGPGVFPGWKTFGLQIVQFWSMVWVASASALLWSTSRHYAWSAVTIFEGLLNLGLSLWAVWRWGLVGVIGATVVASLVTEFWYLPGAAMRMLEIPLGRVARELGGALVVCAVAMAAVVMFWFPGDVLPPWRNVALVTAAAETIFLAVYVWLGCTRADRQLARDLLLPAHWIRK